MNFPRVLPMKTAGGRDSPNHFRIVTKDAYYFQSYNTVVARMGFDHGEDGNVTLLDGYWDNYSATTNRYLNQFLGTDGVDHIRERVKSGRYIVVKVIA